ncbi:hypothetical protein KCU77_g3272, partial [Aureobasidium melanogenum]
MRKRLDSLKQFVRGCDTVLTADDLKQLPFAMAGDFFGTLEACNQVLCEPDLQEAKLLKIVDRLALHNAKLKLLLPSPPPDVSPTSHERELITHYLEIELERSDSDTHPTSGALPSAQYVKKAFKGTILDGDTATAPSHFVDTINALKLYRLLRNHQYRFPATRPSLETTRSLVQAYSWSLADQENDMSLEEEYILRARLIEPTNAVGFGLKRLSNLEMRIEFRDRMNSQVINLQQVVLIPTYVLGPDIGKPRMVISGKDGQDPVQLCFWEGSDLTTLQNALTGYKPVYLGDQYEVEIMPPARLGRLLSRPSKTYKGSIQLWQPNDLSARHCRNQRVVQEIGSQRDKNQGFSRIEPRPSMLIFIGAADGQTQEMTVFGVALNSTECGLDNPRTPSHKSGKMKLVPTSADR